MSGIIISKSFKKIMKLSFHLLMISVKQKKIKNVELNDLRIKEYLHKKMDKKIDFNAFPSLYNLDFWLKIYNFQFKLFVLYQKKKIRRHF